MAKISPVVTVTAKPLPNATLRRHAYAFVDNITAEPNDDEALIRWSMPICPAVIGLSAAEGAPFFDRIERDAVAAGATVASAGCQPNLIIVATTQPQALLVAWHKRNRNMFGAGWPADIRAFMSKSRPVRVWYNTIRTSADGAPSSSGPTAFGGAPVVIAPIASRLQFVTVRSLLSAIVVVDLSQAKGFDVGPVADYVAMVGLAKLNLDADLGEAPTILRLFTAPKAERPEGLTDWDQGFLSGLYRTDQDYRFQRTEIALRVAGEATVRAGR